MSIIAIVIFCLLFVSLLLFVMAFARTQKKEDITSRIKKLRTDTDDREKTPEQEKSARVKIDDVFKQSKEKFSPLAARLINKEKEDYFSKKFLQAGKYDETILKFASNQIFYSLAFGGGVGFVLFFLILGYDFMFCLGAMVVLAIIGYYFPLIKLNTAIDRRRLNIFRALPDILDLIVICLEAGMGLTAAMNKVIERSRPSVLRDELDRTLKEIQLGKPRLGALRDLAQRVDMKELSTVVVAMVQAEQMGSSLAQTLKIQSEIIREQRWQKAQEMAQKAPIKLIFPIVFLIFPTLFVVIFGPIVLSFMLGK